MENLKKKILIATPLYRPDIGGPATYTELLENKLPAHGFLVDILSFSAVRSFPKIVRHFLFFLKVLKRAWKYDFVYVQDPVSVGFPTFLACRLLGKKFGIRVAGDYAWEQGVQRFNVKDSIDDFQTKKYGPRVEFLRFIQSTVVKNASFVVTPSFYFSKIVSAWNPKIKPVTIYNGLDLSDFLKTKPSLESKVIISSGRLVPWKGFKLLIKILTSLPGWKLVILGDGPEKSKLTKVATELGVSDRVFFAGALSKKEMIKHLETAEIFVLNTAFESFSFQTVEAMATGLPVVVSNVGSLPELVEDSKQGFLMEYNNEEELLRHIRKIDSNNTIKQSLSWNGKERAKNFSVDKTISNLIKLFDTV